MKEFDKESLSALLDDEVGELAVRQLLKLYDQNIEIAESWERYNLVRSLLHGEAVPVKSSLMTRVREQLDKEEQLSVPIFTNWQQSIFKLGIAASVALVCVLLAQVTLGPASPEIRVADQGRFESFSSENTRVPFTGSFEFAADAKAQELLKEYISRIEIDKDEPPRSEHIQDSPLFRLVNELQSRDSQ